jgi:hypothetical protein
MVFLKEMVPLGYLVPPGFAVIEMAAAGLVPAKQPRGLLNKIFVMCACS